MKTHVRLADFTTLRIGGLADKLVEVTTEDDLITAVRDADAAGEPVLLLSGGSNVVIGDDGFRGTVIKVATRGIRVDADMCSGAMVHIQAGEDWDTVVQRAIAEEWSGLESMSGIPGLTGSTIRSGRSSRPTAASATGTHASRQTPRGTSYSTSRSS